MVPRESRIEKEQVRISSVKPLQLVGIGEDGAVCLAAIGLVLFLRVNAVKLRRLIAPRSKGAEVDVGRAVSRHRGDAELGEEVNAVRGRGDTDGLDVFDCETDQVGVAEVFHSGKVLRLMLVVIVAEMDQRLLELREDL